MTTREGLSAQDHSPEPSGENLFSSGMVGIFTHPHYPMDALDSTRYQTRFMRHLTKHGSASAGLPLAAEYLLEVQTTPAGREHKVARCNLYDGTGAKIHTFSEPVDETLGEDLSLQVLRNLAQSYALELGHTGPLLDRTATLKDHVYGAAQRALAYPKSLLTFVFAASGILYWLIMPWFAVFYDTFLQETMPDLPWIMDFNLAISQLVGSTGGAVSMVLLAWLAWSALSSEDAIQWAERHGRENLERDINRMEPFFLAGLSFILGSIFLGVLFPLFAAL